MEKIESSFAPETSVEKYEGVFELLDNFRDAERTVLAQEDSRLSGEKRTSPKRASRLASFLLSSVIALGVAEGRLVSKALAQETVQEKAPKVLITPERQKALENERQKDFEEIDQIIKDYLLVEKLQFLQETYGEAIESFLVFNRIPITMSTVRDIRLGLEENDPDIFVNKKNPLAMTAGSIVSGYREHWKELTNKEKLERAGEIEVKGFEGIPDLTNAKVLEMLQKLYPPQWLRGSVREIAFSPEVRPAGEEGTFVLGGAERFGIGAMLKGDTRAPITIYNIPGGHSVESIFDTLHHEIAHANSWENSRILSNRERLMLLYEVTQRYLSEDSYNSEYVESIKLENHNAELYKKVSEYWAEICREFFSPDRHDKFRVQHPRDADLVENWFKMINNLN